MIDTQNLKFGTVQDSKRLVMSLQAAEKAASMVIESFGERFEELNRKKNDRVNDFPLPLLGGEKILRLSNQAHSQFE